MLKFNAEAKNHVQMSLQIEGEAGNLGWGQCKYKTKYLNEINAN
jgi:hypothetical protein